MTLRGYRTASTYWCALLGCLLVLACSRATADRVWTVTTTTELLNAVAALPSDGGTINLMPGSYSLTSPITITNKTNVRFIGGGWGTWVVTTADCSAFVFSNSSYCLLKNMSIAWSAGTSGTASGVVFNNGSSSCTVDSCQVTAFRSSGVRFDGTSATPLTKNTVCYSHLLDNRGDNLRSYYNNDFYFVGNQLGSHQDFYVYPHPFLPTSGTLLDHCTGGTYTLNYHWDNEVGLRLGPGSSNNRIENNRIEMSHKQGILIGTSGGAVNYRNVISGNTIHTNSDHPANDGVYNAVEAYGAEDLIFTGNQFFNWSGLHHKNGVEMMDTACKNWVLKNNHFFGHAVSAYVTRGTGHIVTGNITN